jgi:hypothetical protein
VNEVYLVAGVALLLCWGANGLVLRMRNWHQPMVLAFGLVGLTAGLAYVVLPQVTNAGQNVLVTATWVSLLSLIVKLAVLGRIRGMRLGAPTAILAWLLELVTLVGLSLAILMGAFAR